MDSDGTPRSIRPVKDWNAVSAPILPASKTLWGIDWASALPRRLTDDDVDLVASRIDAVLPFIAAHYAEIFEQDMERAGFFGEPFDGAKMRYMQSADVLEVRQAGQTIGLLIGAPSDWSTYYLRSVAFLRAYQGRQLHARILPWMFGELARAGVRRVEAETSPSNLATVQLLTRMRFNVTGNVLTERWGALLRFTRYLDESAEDVFLDKFCTGIRYQRRDRPIPPLPEERSSR
jgi:hypothetical protein